MNGISFRVVLYSVDAERRCVDEGSAELTRHMPHRLVVPAVSLEQDRDARYERTQPAPRLGTPDVHRGRITDVHNGWQNHGYPQRIGRRHIEANVTLESRCPARESLFE